MNWMRLLAYLTGSVDQELLLRNEYLATENRILRNQLKGRLRLSNDERISLAKIGKQLGRKALEEVAQIVRPETILAWHRKLVAKKFDGTGSGETRRRRQRPIPLRRHQQRQLNSARQSCFARGGFEIPDRLRRRCRHGGAARQPTDCRRHGAHHICGL